MASVLVYMKVNAEIGDYKQIWNIAENKDALTQSSLMKILSAEQVAQIDEFDRIQLQGVIEVCQKSKSMADAGRRLFSVSREQRQTTNDSDRVKKYLAKFALSWDDVNG
jgi:transcriptional regulatory protein RtcR